MTWTRRLITMALVLGTGLAVGLFLGKSEAKTSTTPKPTSQSKAKFETLLAVIRPQANEDLFDTIPWQVSLWDARKLAAKEGKPILLWEMDGHPLGCG